MPASEEKEEKKTSKNGYFSTSKIYRYCVVESERQHPHHFWFLIFRVINMLSHAADTIHATDDRYEADL